MSKCECGVELTPKNTGRQSHVRMDGTRKLHTKCRKCQRRIREKREAARERLEEMNRERELQSIQRILCEPW